MSPGEQYDEIRDAIHASMHKANHALGIALVNARELSAVRHERDEMAEQLRTEATTNPTEAAW